MNSTKRYENIFLQQEAIARTQAEHRKEAEDFIMGRLNCLRGVAHSVLRKTLGYAWWDGDLAMLREDYAWTGYGRLELLSLGTTAIHVRLTHGRKVTEVSIPRQVLHLSDRDLATRLRSRIRNHKASERAKEMAQAERDIRTTERKIAQMKQEMARLSNLAEKNRQVVEEEQKRQDALAQKNFRRSQKGREAQGSKDTMAKVV